MRKWREQGVNKDSPALSPQRNRGQHVCCNSVYLCFCFCLSAVMIFCPLAHIESLPFHLFLCCCFSFSLIVGQKVTFYLQPHNIIIWSWHRGFLCNWFCVFVRPLCAFLVCACVFRAGTIKFRKPSWPPIPNEPNVSFLSAWGDSIQKPQDWHQEQKLVFFGYSWHDNVPWSLEHPHGCSNTLSSTIFSSSVTTWGYIDLTLQIKGGDKSPLLFVARGDSRKCSALSNLTAGVM